MSICFGSYYDDMIEDELVKVGDNVHALLVPSGCLRTVWRESAECIPGQLLRYFLPCLLYC